MAKLLIVCLACVSYFSLVGSENEGYYVVSDQGLLETAKDVLDDIINSSEYPGGKEDLEQEIKDLKTLDELKQWFLEKMSEDYGNPDSQYHRQVTHIVDVLQRKLKCCGAYGDADCNKSWALYKSGSKWYQKFDFRVPMVPESCCNPANVSLCTGEIDFLGPPVHGPPVPYLPGHKNNSALYMEGCIDKIHWYALNNSPVTSYSFWLLSSMIALMTVNTSTRASVL